jgi:hypothetical protein
MSTEEFSSFNLVFQYCRPSYKDYKVYEVDTGLPTDYSLTMHATNGTDTVSVVLSKEWFVDNFKAITGLTI